MEARLTRPAQAPRARVGRGVTLRDNQRMRRLAKSLGFRQSMEKDDPTLVHMELDLTS